MSNVASTKSNVASTLLLVWTGLSHWSSFRASFHRYTPKCSAMSRGTGRSTTLACHRILHGAKAVVVTQSRHSFFGRRHVASWTRLPRPVFADGSDVLPFGVGSRPSTLPPGVSSKCHLVFNSAKDGDHRTSTCSDGDVHFIHNTTRNRQLT